MAVFLYSGARMAAYRFALNVTWSAYSADLLAMMRALAYKTLAPSGVALTGPEGSGDAPDDAAQGASRGPASLQENKGA